MKTLFSALLLLTIATSLSAQQKRDSIQVSTDSVNIKTKKLKIRIGRGEDGTQMSFDDQKTKIQWGDSTHRRKKNGFSFGLTFTRFDLGFAPLLDNGSFTLSKKNDFLQYRFSKTSNVGFDVFKFGYRFNDNFKISLAAGFDWTLIRLEKNITILPNQPVLTFHQDSIGYSKNRFSSKYLLLPLSFDWRTDYDRHGKRFHLVLGPEAGFLIDGKVKQISNQLGKQKFYDGYHFSKFEYGGFARVGYGSAGIFAKYYLNDMFENSPEQQGLKSFSFGLMFGF